MEVHCCNFIYLEGRDRRLWFKAGLGKLARPERGGRVIMV
jgi:hypothetical protein